MFLTREILHQSMWNWALNFLSQLMTGSISWLQRSWLWGLSTSRRHEEKGTSAPTITYTLRRGEERRVEERRVEERRGEERRGEWRRVEERRGEEPHVTCSCWGSLYSAFLLHWMFFEILLSSKTSAWIFDAHLWQFMWAVPLWNRPTDSVCQRWWQSVLI